MADDEADHKPRWMICELLHSSGITRDAAEHLQKLIKEAEQVLAGSHPAAGSSASLRGPLVNAALDFEASHPVLAGSGERYPRAGPDGHLVLSSRHLILADYFGSVFRDRVPVSLAAAFASGSGPKDRHPGDGRGSWSISLGRQRALWLFWLVDRPRAVCPA